MGRVDFKSTNQLPGDVHEINITDVHSQDGDSVVKNLLQVDDDELIQHWTYLSNQSVIDDIQNIFRTGRSNLELVNPPYPENEII